MFVEETNKIFVVEDNRVVESFVKQAYYGSCPHPDCEEHGATKYDIKKNENCKSCNTSMKVEFPKGKTPKKDSEDKDTSSDKDEPMTTSSKTAAGFLGEVPEWEDTPGLSQEAPIPGSVPQPRQPNEEDNVHDWRVQRLTQMGFDPQKALGLASNPNIDLHQAENMINNGATPDQIERVLSRVAAEEAPAMSSDEEEEEWKEDEEAETSSEDTSSEKKGLGKGSRVSHREKEGTVISMVPGIYGDTFGVKFDDGKVAEFLSEQLTAVESEKQIYLSSIEEIVSDHIEYDLAPANTLDELEGKTRVARSLNLRAKGLIVGSKISMNERVQLDNIITSTSADIRDFNEGTSHLQEIEAEAYLARSPKYKINDEFIGWGSQARTKTDEDVSWLNDVDTEFDITSDPKLIAIASNSVGSLTREQLENDDFMKEVHYYSALNLPAEASPRLASFMKAAAKMRLEEPIQSIAKQASVESFDDVDDAALYM